MKKGTAGKCISDLGDERRAEGREKRRIGGED